MTIEHLRQICASPAINIAGLASMAGISRRFLIQIRDGDRNLTAPVAARVAAAVAEIHELTETRK